MTALLLFGVSFGYVEATVVVYLRALYEPLQQRFHPYHAAGELFPLLQLDQLEDARPQAMRWLGMELVREAATLAMLAAMGLAVATHFRHGFAAFLIVFGLWDIFYYLFLKVLLDWPDSILTWDLLFLLPVPWAAPVLAPALVALTMVATGVVIFVRETVGRPLCLGRFHWLTGATAGIILATAFCWDYRNLVAGGEPNPFHWRLFVVGEGIGLAAFVHALWRSGDRQLPYGRGADQLSQLSISPASSTPE